MKRSMMKVFSPLAILTIAAALLFSVASTAFAADTWTPDFGGANHHVYIDSKLTGTAINADAAAHLEADLQQRSDKEGIEYYFVYTSLGDDRPAPGQSKTDFFMSKITTRWQAQSGFPLDTYQIILLVRDGKGRHIWALNGGNEIQKRGLTPNFAAYGGEAFKTYMPEDPAGFVDAVADKINSAIQDQKDAAAQQAAEAARQRAEQQAAEARQQAHDYFMAHTLWKIIAACAFAVLLLTFTILYVLKSKKMKQALANFRTYALQSAELSDKLQKKHESFLQYQKAYADAFEGETKVRFTQALADYSNLVSRGEAIRALYQQASSTRTFPFFWVCDSVTAMVTTAKGEWTGDELPDDKKTLKEFFEKVTWSSPEELFNNFQELYDRTNSELSGIKDAFDQVEANAASIKKTLSEIDGVRPTLKEAKLPFEPYQKRYNALKARADAVASQLKNPIGAKAESNEVQTGVAALKSDMLRAVSLKQSYGQTETVIAQATERVATQRATTVVFRYPFTDGEEHPTPSSKTFALAEDNGNPDAAIKAASAHYAASQAALDAAQLDEAQTEQQKAEAKAGEANSIVDAVMAAKQFIELQVQPTRTDLSNLRSETTAAEPANAELNASFIPANFDGVKGNLSTAKRVAADTDGQLDKVRSAYFEQRFLAARATLTSTDSSVNSARQGLKDMDSRLTTLKKLREHAKSTSAKVTELNNALAIKAKQNFKFTSTSTDGLLAAQQQPAASLATDVAQTITDWVSSASSADTILAALREVDHKIDSEKASYDLATQHVSELSGRISTAKVTIENDDTRQPAVDRYNSAVTTLNTANRNLQTPKSDWGAIVRTIDGAGANVDEAVRMAQNDQRLAAEARAGLQSAATKINTVSDTAFAMNQSIGGNLQTFDAQADLSSAESSFESAKSYLADRKYEKAIDSAKEAFRQADAARKAAQDAVATQIATAVAAYEAEQLRIRRQQEAEAAAIAAAAQAAADAAAAERARQQPVQQSYNSGNDNYSNDDRNVGSSNYSNDDRTVGNDSSSSDSRTVGGGDQDFGS